MLIMSSNVWFRSSLIFLILYFSVSRSSSIWQTIKNNSSKNGSGNLPTGKSSQWLQWSRSPPDQSWRWASGCSSQPARLGIRSSSTCTWGEQRCRKYLRQKTITPATSHFHIHDLNTILQCSEVFRLCDRQDRSDHGHLNSRISLCRPCLHHYNCHHRHRLYCHHHHHRHHHHHHH